MTDSPSPKVAALLAGHTSIDRTWTERDFLDLALAALDQGGMSAADQDRVSGILESQVDQCHCCSEPAVEHVGDYPACADCAAESRRNEARGTRWEGTF